MRLLTEAEFCEVLDVEFEDIRAPGSFKPGARLVDDLHLDSLDLLRLVIFVESLAPIELPDQLDPSDATVGDLYHYYVTLSSAAAPIAES